MKKMLALALATLTSITAFGQGKEQKKTPDQVMQEVREIQDKFILEGIGSHISYFQNRLKTSKSDIDERAAFYKKLDESLTDGDPVLIEKALSNIHSNAFGVRMDIKSLKEAGAELQNQIESAFKSELINEARYLELRNMIRTGIAESEKVIPAEYAKLMEKAKVAAPDHFAHLEEMDKRLP